MKQITSIRKAVCIMAKELSKVIDTGIQVKASLMRIISGYSYKETLGALIYISI